VIVNVGFKRVRIEGKTLGVEWSEVQILCPDHLNIKGYGIFRDPFFGQKRW